MRSCSFYSFSDFGKQAINYCSVESDRYALSVNCAGQIVLSNPFITDNKDGRLDFYLMYILSGELLVANGDTNEKLNAGSVAIFEPKVGYRYTYLGGETLDYLWIHFTGHSARAFLEECAISVFPQYYSTANENRIVQRFQDIFDAFSRKDRYRDRELGALLERLLISVARAIDDKNMPRCSLSRSLGYINSHYDRAIKIPDLAAMEHISTSRYNCLFKLEMGQSPSSYILRIRMSSACELLRNTDVCIKQIGVMCGYSDPHFFSKVFKKYIGMSPSEYRNCK